jgi:hypothetical protein
MSTKTHHGRRVETAVRKLAAAFGGRLVRSADPGYDEHLRVWSGSIDGRHSNFSALCAREAEHLALSLAGAMPPP